MEKFEILQNKIEAVNELHVYINRLVPLYKAQLEKGFKINIGLEFSKKDKAALKAIELPAPKRIRHYFKISNYSIYICFDTNYMVSDCSCEYYEVPVYIYDSVYIPNQHFNPIPFASLKEDYTKKEVITQQLIVDGFKRRIKGLESQIDKARTSYRMFIPQK